MSELNPFALADYSVEAEDRVTEQFREQPVFNKYLQLMLAEQIKLQLEFKKLMQERSIDTAVGEQLDIIGRIVGQPRVAAQGDLFNLFGFEEDFSAESFSSLTAPDTGGYWYSLGDPLGGNVILGDDMYRLFIKAKIIKNNTASTPEDFIRFCNFIFGVGSVTIQDSTDITPTTSAAVEVTFTRELTKFEKWLLHANTQSDGRFSNFMPKTIGVTFTYYDMYGVVINPVV